ncbi:hypothetical protein [Sinomonas flava]|uniref:hypothetical protein n=1 Tax=Sinomonas flava TaxID=496857 RepID=UPI0039A5C2F1
MEENEPADSWGQAFDDLVALIEHPIPARVHWIENGSPEERDEARAVAVAWGWLMRAKRTAQAVLGLEKLGFGAEAAPLECSVLEHSARLLWAAQHEGPERVRILLGASPDEHARDRRPGAPAQDWPGGNLELIEGLPGEDASGEGTEGGGRLGRVVLTLPAGQAPLRRLLERAAAASHPGAASAEPYFEASADGRGWLLRLLPPGPAPAFDAEAAALLLVALEAYVRIAGLEARFGPRIDALAGRMGYLRAGAAETEPTDAVES